MRTKKFLRVGLSVMVSAVALTLLLVGIAIAAPAANGVGGVTLLLSKTAQAPDVVVPGATVTYTINAMNTSTNTAAMSVTLTDMLPHEVSFAGWVISDAAKTMMKGHTITWTGDITTGGAVTLQFAAMIGEKTAQFGDVITNTVEVTGTNLEALQTDSAVLSLAASPVCLKKMVMPTMSVKAGDMVTYTIRTKDLMGGSRDIMVTDTLPSVVEFGSWVSAPEGVTETDGVITWSGTITGAARVFVFTGELLMESETVTYPLNNMVENMVWAVEEGAPDTKVSASAVFGIEEGQMWYYIFLPVVMRNFSGG